MRGSLLPIALAMTSCAGGHAQPAFMTPAQLKALPSMPADHRIPYGPHESQFADLRLPSEPGPHPVIVLIHGGCWKREYASLSSLAPMADALKTLGIATWNIEYRRLGEDGGGWPGTYRDVAQAIDHLRAASARYDLDLSRVVLLGHSAGGHLAHWAAARPRLMPPSDLYSANPLPVRGVVNLAGRADMTAGISGIGKLCRDTVVEKLLGGTPASVPQRYRESSPSSLLPLGVRQILISGDHEEYVPLPLARSYVKSAIRAGDQARLIVVPNAGHFELANPKSAAWPTVLAAIRTLVEEEQNPSAGPE